MIYCDTSFLLALYVETDCFHLPASRLAMRFKESIPLTLLTELELTNGFRRCFASKIIDRSRHDAIFRQLADDEAQGILFRQSLGQDELFAKARELSKKFTPLIAARSLDILHVASALLLKAGEFASFDEKQRILAGRVDLEVIPSTMAGKRKR